MNDSATRDLVHDYIEYADYTEKEKIAALNGIIAELKSNPDFAVTVLERELEGLKKQAAKAGLCPECGAELEYYAAEESEESDIGFDGSVRREWHTVPAYHKCPNCGYSRDADEEG